MVSHDEVAQSSLTVDANPIDPLHTNCEESRKNVQFDNSLKIISYECDARMRKQMWYRKADYKRFHHEKKETLRHFRHAQSRFQRIHEDIFCLRGFEACLSARAVQQRLLHKVAGFQAVLETQVALRNQGNDDPCSKIKAGYQRVSTPARKQALERAALDAAEVRGDHSRGEESDEVASLKSQIDRLMLIKGRAVPQTSLRSASSGPLRLRKTVPSTA